MKFESQKLRGKKLNVLPNVKMKMLYPISPGTSLPYECFLIYTRRLYLLSKSAK